MKKLRFTNCSLHPFKYHFPNARFHQSQQADHKLLLKLKNILYTNHTRQLFEEMSLSYYSSKMKTSFGKQVIRIPIGSASYSLDVKPPKGLLPDPADKKYTSCSTLKQSNKVNSVLNRMNKLGKRADSFARGFKEHVRLGPKITETVKGKLSLGARILQVGGVEKIFKKVFSVGEEEKLYKACQCYLSTTSGPIAGLLFISTQKIAFCSEKSIKFISPNGQLIRFRYKVIIPLNKIKRLNQTENAKKPSQKYMEIVTVDDFDFWFMGFLNYQNAFKYIQQAISQS